MKRVLILMLLFTNVGISEMFGQGNGPGFNLVFSENLRGDIIVIGNTNMASYTGTSTSPSYNTIHSGTAANVNNDTQNMRFIDLDGTSGTSNSSRAGTASFTTIPSSATIKRATLYWGAAALQSTTNPVYNGQIVNLSTSTSRTVKVRRGTSTTYTTLQAQRFDYVERDVSRSNDDGGVGTNTIWHYVASVDVTSVLAASGGAANSDFWVADIPATQNNGTTGGLNAISGGGYAGWYLVIVYEDNSLPFKSVRLYDGTSIVFSNGDPFTSTFTLTGLNTPSGPSNANFYFACFEGDAGLSGEYVQVNPPSTSDVTTNRISNSLNPATNLFNGSYTRPTATAGVAETVGSRLPDLTNSLSLDVDKFDVSQFVPSGSTTASIRFFTNADAYYPGLFAFSALMTPPAASVTKTVTDANNNNLAESGEELTYTFNVVNSGTANANATFISDPLPNLGNINLNSISITQNGTTGATGSYSSSTAVQNIISYNSTTRTLRVNIGNNPTSAGGVLPAGSSFNMTFKFQLNTFPSNQTIPSIINIASLQTSSDAAEIFTDQSTATIVPQQGSTLPIHLANFSGAVIQNRRVLLKWSSYAEWNNAYYQIERSADGVKFSTIGKINGNGTTNQLSKYQFEDIFPFNDEVVFYRLKQVDTDGKYFYTSILRLFKEGTRTGWYIKGSNVFNDQVVMAAQMNETSQIQYRLISANGLVIANGQWHADKGMNNFYLQNLGKLQRGLYLLQVSSGEDQQTFKLMKQ